MKDLVILGGPNGGGKTTAARVLLPEFYSERSYLNADEIAREVSPRNVESAAFSAGRILIARMRSFVRDGRGFTFETTFSGKSYLPLLRECKASG